MSEDAITNLLRRVTELERLVALLTRERDMRGSFGPIDQPLPMPRLQLDYTMIREGWDL